ncbi:MAG TPA: tetratricopeptide repeat protein [Vicinamibacteria bacterium]|nr:tetratricopeptide repeat protein [Vicinamibacteria bacterium]
MSRPSRWGILVLAGLLACGRAPEESSRNEESSTFVGRETCARCHPAQEELWEGSHHDLAMEPATEATVKGDFSGVQFANRGVTSTFSKRDGKFLVETDGPDGQLAEYEIEYTFGADPLQQYLVAFPKGRYQALSIAWDTRPEAVGGQRWFHLYPDETIDHRDPLHWTKLRQNWNLMCAECHSTALEKGFDVDVDGYETKWSEIDVACEACHGPGSRHVAWAETEEGNRPAQNGLTVSLSDDDGGTWMMDMETGLSTRSPARSSRMEIETCARCHARRSPQRAGYQHGQPLMASHRPALLTEPLYFPDGQILEEVYVYGSFLQSKMYQRGVTCKDCHDPHALTVRGEGNSVCAGCHLPEKFDSTSHHHHSPGSAGASCVECHMPARTYMVVDPRHDHSFRIPRPDLSLDIGVPNACSGCHRDRDPAWAREAVVRWYGEEVSPHYGEALAAARRGAPSAGRGLDRLAGDAELPAIVRATALSMMAAFPAGGAGTTLLESRTDPDPLVRMGAVESAEGLTPAERHQFVVPLLRDPMPSVRIEAARVLGTVPKELFTPQQAVAREEGIAEFRDAQLRNADWPESHLNLGNLHLALGERPQARRAFETAIRVDPDFAGAYVNLADLLRVEGMDDEGEALLRQALERLPDDPALHHALGLTLVRQRRAQEALPELARAAMLQPEEPRFSYVHGVALQSTGDLDGAAAVFTAAIDRHPYDRDLLLALAHLHRELEDWSKAIDYARRLTEVDSENPEAHRYLAELEAHVER